MTPAASSPIRRFANAVRIVPAGLLLALLLPILPSALSAQPAATTIEGRVLNTSNGLYLNNARVSVEGTTLEAFTNENGEFRLAGLAPGEVRLRVAYTGLESQTATVRVAAGGAARRDFELALPRGQTTAGAGEVVKLEQFVVEAAALSAQAAAINEQKYSPNIKNVVVLEEIGDLGDGNIGEYLKYTPGLSIVSGPQTAASASIRGMPAGGVIFMIDGAEVSSPSVDRNFDLAASSSGSVDRIEITKVPTPDRPANAVGGTVNIVGRSGFANQAPPVPPQHLRRLQLRQPPQPAEPHHPRGQRPPFQRARHPAGFRSQLLASRQQGLRVHDQPQQHAARVYDMDYDSPTWDLVRGVQTTSTIQNVLQTTERQLASTTLDWRINRENALRLNIEHVQINTPTRQNVYATAWGAGNTGGATFTQGAAAGNDLVRQSMTYGDRTRGTSVAVLRYLHEGRTLKFDINANFSRSWDERKDLENGFFRTVGTATLNQLIVRADGLDGIYDRFAPRLTVTNRAGAPVDPYDYRQLTLSNPTSQPEEIKSDMKSLSANVSRAFALPAPLVIKTGFSVNRQRKDRVSTLKTWTFAPPATVSRLAGAHDLLNESLSRQAFFNDTLRVNWISPVKYYELFQANPTWFTLNEAAPTSRA
jgi:iron complex outermembrane receptor protein